jgi:phage baseplate assembly protein V
MYLVGTIQELDAKAMKARVLFPDKEGLVSPFMPLVVSWAQENRAYRMPDMGEQVACLMDDNLESGCIVGSIYGGSETPPEESGDVAAVHFSDGTVVRHDRASKTLSVQCAGTVIIEAALHIRFAAPTLDMSAVVGGWRFDDGSTIEYNEATKVLKLNSVGDLVMVAERLFSLSVPVLNVACSGASNVQTGGPVTVNAGGPVTVNAGGPINLNAPGVFANGKPIG